MTNLREIITVTALTSLLTMGISLPANAGQGNGGDYDSFQGGAENLPPSLPPFEIDPIFDHVLDPLPGTIFDGRITIRFRSDRLSIIDSGWFGEFSNQPQTPAPVTGDAPFIAPGTSLNFLEPNPNLTVVECNLEDLVGELCVDEQSEESFRPFLPLNIDDDVNIGLTPQDNEDFLFINFDWGPGGLELTTTESFNFFGFSTEFKEEAFEDEIVGIKLVEPGTGDLGLVPIPGFNTINCIPFDNDSNTSATTTCGQENPPLDIAALTLSEFTAASQGEGFTYDLENNLGFLPSGEAFQLAGGRSVNEPSHMLGLLAMGVFGANVALKSRRKHQKNKLRRTKVS